MPSATNGKRMPKDNIAKVVGIIHARGGSTRIPLKNIKPLNGTPLIAYIIGAALASKSLDRVIVSTDHDEIKKIALQYGAEVPFMRPKEISTDCPSEFVTKHAISFVENEQGQEVEIAVSMQPTTPFTSGDDIDACVSMLQENGQWDSVFSGNIVHERPEWMFRVDDNGAASLFLGEVLRGETGVVQSLPKLAMPNGGVYATRRQALFGDNLIISPRTGLHIMSLERSVDIDEPIDFEFAEFMARRTKENHG